MTGAQLAEAALATAPESIAEVNALTAIFSAMRKEDERLHGRIPGATLIAAPDTYGAMALRAMTIEPERAWSVAKGVRMPTGQSFGELVTLVAPHLDGAIPNRNTFYLALGRAVDEAQRVPSQTA